MKRAIDVFNLDENKHMTFVSETPYNAMESLIYYLNLSHADKNAKVDLIGGGRALTTIHNGKTYSCINN